MDMNDYIELTCGDRKLYFHKSFIELCSKSLGKMRGFANRHARPEEQKDIANSIDVLQSLVEKFEGLR
jgi:hypothetical protein